MQQFASETVQLTAYYLWEKRGCPIGSPEVDWFRAEHELAPEQLLEAPESKPPLITAAEKVGSALGSVAGLVASVIHPDEGA